MVEFGIMQSVLSQGTDLTRLWEEALFQRYGGRIWLNQDLLLDGVMLGLYCVAMETHKA